MAAMNEHEEFLLSYWSDLQLAGKDNGNRSSVGIDVSVESPKDKSERLRKLIKFISGIRYSNLISQSLCLSLISSVQAEYARTIDSMNKNDGLNNNAEAIMAIISGQANDSHTWRSSLQCGDGTEQSSLVKEILCTAKDEDSTEKRTLKYQSNTKSIDSKMEKVRLEKGQGGSKEKVQLGCKDNRYRPTPFTNRSSLMDRRTGSGKYEGGLKSHPGMTVNGRMRPPFHSNSEMEISDASEVRHQPVFAKRKHPSVSDAPNKQARINQIHPGLQSESQIDRDPESNFKPNEADYFDDVCKKPARSHEYQRRKYASTLMKQTMKHQRDEDEVDDQNETDMQHSNPFMTARDQYIIDQQKKNRQETSNNGRSIKPSDYGQTKKSLGTRRGASSRFVPPVMMNRGEAALSSNDRATYGAPTASDSRDNDCQDERLKNIEPRMIEMIENEIIDHGPPTTWDDIAGLQFAKNTIQEIVIWPMLRPDIFTGLRGPPKGLLLFGPPGTGKTLIGKCIASQSHATFFSISASSLTSKWIGEGEKMVRALFAVARCQESAVVFIDEIDSLLSQRTDGEHEATRRIKTEFLVQLDGATTKSEERLLVVGATNRPQELDEAARRRLVKRLYIPLPDEDARRQIVANLIKEQNCTLSDEDYLEIVRNTQGYSGADMANLCREAALGPIRSMSAQDIRYIKPDEVRPMIYMDFEMALKSIRPSVSQKDLETYTTWNKLYGSGVF